MAGVQKQIFQRIVDYLNYSNDKVEKIVSYPFTAPYTNLHKALYLVGLASVTGLIASKIYNTLKLFAWVPQHMRLAKRFNQDQFKSRYGSDCWVLITGFTEGIGLAYAKQFARLGYNLVLVGRDRAKMEESTRWVLQYNQAIKIRLVEVDFGASATSRDRLRQVITQQTQDIDVGIVVNNVAAAAGGDFLTIEVEKHINTFHVNVYSLIEINRALLPRLRQRPSRSAIINLSSCTGMYPSPFIGVYSATKAYVHTYSQILEMENRDKIDVLTYAPFGVTTRMMKSRKGPLMITPKQCALRSIYELGHLKVSHGGFMHKLSGAVFRGMTLKQRLENYAQGFKRVINS